MSHICTCGECDVDAFASICKFETELVQQQALNQQLTSEVETLRRLVEFVGSADQAMLDAFVFTETNRKRAQVETDRGDPYLWESGT